MEPTNPFRDPQEPANRHHKVMSSSVFGSPPRKSGKSGNGDEPVIHSRPLPVTGEEAKMYYAGLYSGPILVARSGTTPWEAPTGLEAYSRPKELRVVGDHQIANVWEGDLSLKVNAILDEKQVQWTSTDVVRIGYAGESSAPVVVWIGVKPRTLSPEAGVDVVVQCKALLLVYGIGDVEVEIRESEVFRSAGPPLLVPGFDTDATAEVREALSDTLGIPICAQATPWAEGTGGFFIRASADSETIYLMTARHVVLPPNKDKNTIFERKSTGQSRCDVLVLSDTSFQEFLDSIQKNIDGQHIMVEYQQKRIRKMGEREDGPAVKERQAAQGLLTAAEAEAKDLTDFLQEVSTHWAPEKNRVIGHVVYAPPIAVGVAPDQYTQDVAVIEIDAPKIDRRTFAGSVIDLGFKYTAKVLTPMMYPNPKNAHNFDFPGDRLLSLRNTIPDSEMRKPKMFDHKGDPCIIVLKRGRSTGLTVGRANNIVSYTRNYFGEQEVQDSMEWAILPYDNRSGPFSAPGDSGSVIVDGAGRLGGLLTGGAGITATSDLTYATHISFVMKTIRAYKKFSKAFLIAGPEE